MKICPDSNFFQKYFWVFKSFWTIKKMFCFQNIFCSVSKLILKFWKNQNKFWNVAHISKLNPKFPKFQNHFWKMSPTKFEFKFVFVFFSKFILKFWIFKKYFGFFENFEKSKIFLEFWNFGPSVNAINSVQVAVGCCLMFRHVLLQTH